MSAELTRKQLDDLAAKVEGFVGEDWEQGTADDDVHCEDEGDGTALVMDWEHLMMLLDCNHHDCGAEMAAALVAMHNALPALVQMARASLGLAERLATLESAVSAAEPDRKHWRGMFWSQNREWQADSKQRQAERAQLGSDLATARRELGEVRERMQSAERVMYAFMRLDPNVPRMAHEHHVKYAALKGTP